MNAEGFNTEGQSETPIEPIHFDDSVIIEVPKEKLSTEPASIRRLREIQEAEQWEINRMNHRGQFGMAEAMQINREVRNTKEGLRKEQDKLITDINRAVREVARTELRLLGQGTEYYVFNKADKGLVEEWVLDLLEGFAEADASRKWEIVQALRNLQKFVNPEFFDMCSAQFFPDFNIRLDDPVWDVAPAPAEKPSFFRRVFRAGK